MSARISRGYLRSKTHVVVLWGVGEQVRLNAEIDKLGFTVCLEPVAGHDIRGEFGEFGMSDN